MAKINQQNYITMKHTEVKMNELIKEAAERLYPGIDRQVDRMLFIAGAKSDAARDYWFKIFKEQFKNE